MTFRTNVERLRDSVRVIGHEALCLSHEVLVCREYRHKCRSGGKETSHLRDGRGSPFVGIPRLDEGIHIYVLLYEFSRSSFHCTFDLSDTLEHLDARAQLTLLCREFVHRAPLCDFGRGESRDGEHDIVAKGVPNLPGRGQSDDVPPGVFVLFSKNYTMGRDFVSGDECS